MCDKNINEILVVDFANTNDEFNWLNNTSAPIETVGGQLRLIPENSSSVFRRGLGILDPVNNRIRLQINMDLFRPQTSTHDKINVVFGVYAGSLLIDQFTVYHEGISAGELIEYNFDRVYKYEAIAGNISLKISFPEGFQNQLFLDYLKCHDSTFCEDEVRTYFVLHQLLEKSLASVSSGIQLLEWKIGGIETLTSAFFSENTSVGGNPLAEWLFAKANIDGSGRVSDNATPNTFNPFSDELGLVFDTVNSFHGQKPTATKTGADYGSGILTLGLEKPSVFNGQLSSKKGAFFIDMDYSKDLKIAFNVLVNNLDANVFNSPEIFRKYTIVWDSKNCQKSFYYQDQLATNTTAKIQSDEDGFLFGLTAGVSLQTVIGCNQSFSYTGESGAFEFQIDFGTDIGTCGINFDAFGVPDKFEIEWNGQIFSSGYVGDSYYNQQLINLGIPPNQINTANPANGSGILNFVKSQAFPTTATIRVTAPLSGTGWSMSGICPQPIQSGNFTEISWDDTKTLESRNGVLANETIFYNGAFYPVTSVQWQRKNLIWVDDVSPVASTNTFALNANLNEFRLKALDANLTEVYSNVLQYLKTETFQTQSFYFEGIWENSDPVHKPYLNSWVDYLDANGIQDRFFVGGSENGCQEIVASSIVDTNGVSTCSPLNCQEYAIYPPIYSSAQHIVEYLDCNNLLMTITVGSSDGVQTICAKEIVSNNNEGMTSATGNICI
jgi:hypothetical protein